jgi:hypothetical protein
VRTNYTARMPETPDASGTLPNDLACGSERQAVLDFIAQNKACSTYEDCGAQYAGCGVSEDDCTGAVYVNRFVDEAKWASLMRSLASCTGSESACTTCDRAAPPAACVSGRCERVDFGTSCDDEAQALRDFIEASKSCNTADDCGMGLGTCGLPYSECTGTVWVNSDFDDQAFTPLYAYYTLCLDTAGTPAACSEPTCAQQKAACIAGRCE